MAVFSITADLYKPYFAPSADVEVTAYARITMRVTEGELDQNPTAQALVVDHSGSTEKYIQIIRDGLSNSLSVCPEDSEVALIQFDNTSEVLVPIGTIRDKKFELVQAVDKLYPRGQTKLSYGMENALAELKSAKNPIKTMIIFTDGATQGDEQRCLALAQEAETSGIVIIPIGLDPGPGYSPNYNLLKQIGGNNYAYVEKADQITGVFQEKVFRAVSTVVNNAVLKIQPMDWDAVVEAALVIPSYAPISISPTVWTTRIKQPQEVPLGQLAIGYETVALVKFTGKLPGDVTVDKPKSLGLVTLVGDLPNEGVKQLAATHIIARFSKDAGMLEVVNKEIGDVIKLAAAGRQITAASEATTKEEAEAKLTQAERLTQGFSRKDAADQLIAKIRAAKKDLQEGDLTRAKEKAGETVRNTQGFSRDKALDLIKKMKKEGN